MSERSRTRSAGSARAVHLDKGCYRGQETVARVHNLGRPPRMLVLLHLDGSGDRPATGDPLLADGRAVGRLGTVVDHVDLGPIALALVKRGIPAGTAADAPAASTRSPPMIDPDSLPPADADRRGATRGRKAARRRQQQEQSTGRAELTFTAQANGPAAAFGARHGKVLAGQIRH